jgi:hypothetical protein
MAGRVPIQPNSIPPMEAVPLQCGSENVHRHGSNRCIRPRCSPTRLGQPSQESNPGHSCRRTQRSNPSFPCTGTKARYLSLFLRWKDATRFSLSNTRFRSPPPPPPNLSTLRVRGTLPFNSPSSRNSRLYSLLPNISGVRRQRSHADLHRTQTISGSRSSCPLQRHMNQHHPSTTIDQLAEHHTVLLTDLEVGLPQHETTISALRQQFEAHIRFLRINLESYIALQRSITDARQEQQPPSDPVQATACPLPPAPFDTPHISRQGRFPFYAVRRGRTTGIFNC